MSGYRTLSLAAKRAHPAKSSPRHPGSVYKPQRPREFFCLECRARIPHEQAAAHAARCKGA
jgi:hypothetical protein